MKIAKLVFLVICIELILWGLIINNNHIFLVGLINLVIFVFSYPLYIKKIILFLKDNFIKPLSFDNDSQDVFINNFKYILQNYLFVLFLLYFIIALLDNYLINIFYINLSTPFWLLIISFVILYDEILTFNIYWGKRKILVNDLIFLLCITLLFYLWMGFNYLGLTCPFAIASLLILIIYGILVVSLKTSNKPYYSLFTLKIFVAVFIGSLIYYIIIYFGDIKGMIFKEKLVIREKIVYIDKDAGTSMSGSQGDQKSLLSGNKTDNNLVLNNNTGFSIINLGLSGGTSDIEQKYKGIKYKTVVLTTKKGKIFVLKEYVNGKYIVVIGKEKKEFNNKTKAIEYGNNYTFQ